ncbi:hypothetical protein HS5_16330 [Acidianus sp. HS-5]|nr:hypothetical protein HS5_16330 [Acidianus sp. HS-5]
MRLVEKKFGKELVVAKSEFVNAFNSVVGIMRTNGLDRKVAVALALMALIGRQALGIHQSCST